MQLYEHNNQLRFATFQYYFTQKGYNLTPFLHQGRQGDQRWPKPAQHLACKERADHDQHSHRIHLNSTIQQKSLHL